MKEMIQGNLIKKMPDGDIEKLNKRASSVDMEDNLKGCWENMIKAFQNLNYEVSIRIAFEN